MLENGKYPAKTNNSHDNVSEDDVVSFENFGQPPKSRNEPEETLGVSANTHQKMNTPLGTLGPAGLQTNTLVGSDAGPPSPAVGSNLLNEMGAEVNENESDLPIFGQ